MQGLRRRLFIAKSSKPDSPRANNWQRLRPSSSRSSLHRGEKSSTAVKTSHLAELQTFPVWGWFTAFESASTKSSSNRPPAALMMIADQFEMILQVGAAAGLQRVPGESKSDKEFESASGRPRWQSRCRGWNLVVRPVAFEASWRVVVSWTKGNQFGKGSSHRLTNEMTNYEINMMTVMAKWIEAFRGMLSRFECRAVSWSIYWCIWILKLFRLCFT